MGSYLSILEMILLLRTLRSRMSSDYRMKEITITTDRVLYLCI